MSATETIPVRDSVPKIANELAVGEDLEFQRRWWRFEKVVWVMFLIIVLLDLAGAFGRGPLANHEMSTADGAMHLRYERIERFSTPSIMTIHFGKAAVRDGKIQLWVSDSVVKELGNQRIVPQPLSSITGDNGILYTFPTTDHPDSVEFALQPAHPGLWHLELRIPGASPDAPPIDFLKASIVVMP
jgi:hypothetical protein